MISNKYFNKPKLIHNLWISYDESTYYLTSLKGIYEVPKNDANKFLKMESPEDLTTVEIINKSHMALKQLIAKTKARR